MNKIRIVIASIAIIGLLSKCDTEIKQGAYGYWEGPHPFDESMKFVIEIKEANDSIQAMGFWIKNGLYQAKFVIESVQVFENNLNFSIPDWNCTYQGIVDASSNIVEGGFYCEGEPFDSVKLKKNNTYEYLISPVKGFNTTNYKYLRRNLVGITNGIKVSNDLTEKDSLFIYSIIPEIIEGKYGRMNSFLYIRKNNLLCEEYFFGYADTIMHQLESSTKSIASILIGIAYDKGFIDDLHQPLYKIFPEYDNLKKGELRNITLHHILTMTAGFEINDNELFHCNNFIDYALKRDLVEKPGSKFLYDGGCTEILGGIIKEKTGMFADEFAGKYLFAPLGIKQFNWNENKKENYPCMAGSLQLFPQDIAKIGIMVKDNGLWNGIQVISEKWLEKSTSVHTKTHIDGDNYGYQWWRIKFKTKKKDYKVIWANGLGSQFIFIIPELDIVIVTTGHNYEQNNSWDIVKGIESKIHLLIE